MVGYFVRLLELLFQVEDMVTQTRLLAEFAALLLEVSVTSAVEISASNDVHVTSAGLRATIRSTLGMASAASTSTRDSAGGDSGGGRALSVHHAPHILLHHHSYEDHVDPRRGPYQYTCTILSCVLDSPLVRSVICEAEGNVGKSTTSAYVAPMSRFVTALSAATSQQLIPSVLRPYLSASSTLDRLIEQLSIELKLKQKQYQDKGRCEFAVADEKAGRDSSATSTAPVFDLLDMGGNTQNGEVTQSAYLAGKMTESADTVDVHSMLHQQGNDSAHPWMLFDENPLLAKLRNICSALYLALSQITLDPQSKGGKANTTIGCGSVTCILSKQAQAALIEASSQLASLQELLVRTVECGVLISAMFSR